MPSQLVKCAFGFRSFNAPKTKCVPLSVELGSEQGGARAPPHVVGPVITICMSISQRLAENYYTKEEFERTS